MVFKRGLSELPYYVGISSLSEIATRQDRVCVLNILGSESKTVTPVSHVFSGGNVVFGTSPGKGGSVLKTSLNDIPVYNNVREGMEAGHEFNTGVVYLPPAGVRDGVAELARVNSDLRKLVIVTEKVSVHDAREIRSIGQSFGIDIFGANCLGIADSWNQVRIGGALGGDLPEEVLHKGSIAILSNSGSFTSTIAQYLALHGWGTTTLVSSGKDVFINYAAREFALALSRDARSKGAVLYVEPGGYYEMAAEFEKPIVACVVGRWKSRLTRAVGHAGALAGVDDSAEAKERWFMEKLEVDALFTPAKPVASRKGAVVTTIAHIPAALAKVMALNDIEPDFEALGDLSLKPWMANDQHLRLPSDLSLAVVDAPEPYKKQIQDHHRQIGVTYARQQMKDASAASRMDESSQVTSLYGHSILDLAQEPLEAQFALPLVHGITTANGCSIVSVALLAELYLSGLRSLTAAEASRDMGNGPNMVMAAAAILTGPKCVERPIEAMDALIDLFASSGLSDASDVGFDTKNIVASDAIRTLFKATGADDTADVALIQSALSKRGAGSIFLNYIAQFREVSHDTVLAALAATLIWEPLMSKRISRLTARTSVWHLRVFASMLGSSIPSSHHQRDQWLGVGLRESLEGWGLAEIMFSALTRKPPTPVQAQTLQRLVGLLTSNGPGSITAQGAKGAVSADGPQDWRRVQINKAAVGFLSHCGYSHGGNGFEGVAFLLEHFRDCNLGDPTDKYHRIDLAALAEHCAQSYIREKWNNREAGGDGKAIPGVHHPVFKGKPLNFDPRERHIMSLMDREGSYNIFLDFYHKLVRALYDAGATPYVFCVNIDGVIAALLLGMVWDDYREGHLTLHDLETAAFTIFLYGRMIGAAAEIDDHLNRGRNMDTRTPPDACRFIV